MRHVHSHSNKGKPIGYREPTRPLHPLVHHLRKRRYDLGLGAEAVAAKIGYDYSTVQGWEHGASKPTLRSLEVWAEGLGMKLQLVEMEYAALDKAADAAREADPSASDGRDAPH